MLLAMAASEERAERIRLLKKSRPDLTWDRIGDYCGVKERSAVQWSRSGGITHENCGKLATLFGVEEEWLWSGREQVAGTAPLMSVLVGERTQLDRIEEKLDRLLAATSLRTPEEIAAEAAQQQHGTKASSPASEPRKPKRRRAA